MQNWVLVSNPGLDHAGVSQGAVTATIKVAGNTIWSGSIAPGADVTRTFPGKMGGPVQVTASGDTIASQRVLYNGYFNEVLGQ